MKNARLLMGFFLVLAVQLPLWAEGRPSGFRFLKLMGGARSLSLSEGGVAVSADDLDGLDANPAASVDAARPMAEAGYAQVFERLNVARAGGLYPTMRRGVWALTVDRAAHEGVEGYSASDARTGTLEASATAARLSWARRLGRRTAVGVSARSVQETLGPQSSGAFSFDAGVQHAPSWGRGLTLGAAVRQAGSGDSPLPTDLTLGAAGRFFGDALTLAADFRRTDQKVWEPVASAEMWVKDVLAFRAGMRGGTDSQVSAGLGVKVSRQVGFNYAFLPNEALGAAHRASVTFRFGGGKAESLFQEGLKRMREGQYAAALLLFDKTLTLEPTHPHAARLLKEAASKLPPETLAP